ncbi:MAG: hypothetical protein WCI05_09195, partial [Myxococcales bacterium]
MTKVPYARLAPALLLLLSSSSAQAQMPGGRRPGGGGQPAPSTPTQQRNVGPRAGGAADDDDRPVGPQRKEPSLLAPSDPLALSPELRARIGSDWDGRYPSPEGSVDRTKWFPYYEERRGDTRFRLLPPLFLEQTRGLAYPPTQGRYGVPSSEDTEGLYGLLYYRRRSLKSEADVLFPLLWRVRQDEDRVWVGGPLVHREAPGEHDNWLFPLVFEGERKSGGYLHMPLLLTTSHWDQKGAFTLVGPYFRDRTGGDVDLGVFPLFFQGDTGDRGGNRKQYTLIPPLLFYHRAREIDDSTLTVAGPVLIESNRKRDIVDVLPLFFHIQGKPQASGIREEHTTVFPLFHYGHTDDRSMFVVPGYLRSITPKSDTLITPFVSHATGRGGATSLWLAGPIIPLFANYTDRDLGIHAWGAVPFYYQSDSPRGFDFLTPLFARFETYGVSRSYWVFPTLTVNRDTHGWSTNLLPIFFMGRDHESAHTVIAPFFWDFADEKKRTTIGFPVYWRFAGAD